MQEKDNNIIEEELENNIDNELDDENQDEEELEENINNDSNDESKEENSEFEKENYFDIDDDNEKRFEAGLMGDNEATAYKAFKEEKEYEVEKLINSLPEKQIDIKDFINFEDVLEKYPNYEISVLDSSKVNHKYSVMSFPTKLEKDFGWRKSDTVIKASRSEKKKSEAYDEKTGTLIYQPTNKIITGSYKQNVKNNNVTADMFVKGILYDSNYKTKNVEFKKRVNELYNYLFGGGNPSAAFKCFLDKNLLKVNIYKYDDVIIKKFKESVRSSLKSKIMDFRVNYNKYSDAERLENLEEIDYNDVAKSLMANICGKTYYMDKLSDILDEYKNEHNDQNPKIYDEQIRKAAKMISELKDRLNLRSGIHIFSNAYDRRLISKFTDFFSNQLGMPKYILSSNSPMEEYNAYEERQKLANPSLAHKLYEMTKLAKEYNKHRSFYNTLFNGSIRTRMDELTQELVEQYHVSNDMIELLENYGKLNQERIAEIANNFKLGLSNENVANKNTLFTNVMMADLIMESSNNLDFKNEILKVKMDYCTQAVDAYKDFKGNNAEVENKNVLDLVYNGQLLKNAEEMQFNYQINENYNVPQEEPEIIPDGIASESDDFSIEEEVDAIFTNDPIYDFEIEDNLIQNNGENIIVNEEKEVNEFNIQNDLSNEVQKENSKELENEELNKNK